MGWLKWIVPLLLIPVTFGLSIYLYPVLFLWTWIKLALTIDRYIVKFTTILIFYVISRPFVWAGHSVQRLAKFVHQGVELVEYHPKRYGVAYLIVAGFFFWAFPGSLLQLPPMPTMMISDPLGAIMSFFGFLLSFSLLVVPGVLTVLAGMLYHKTIGVDIPELELPSGPDVRGRAQAAKGAAATGGRAAMQGAQVATQGAQVAANTKGVYDDLQAQEGTRTSKGGHDSITLLLLDVGLDVAELVGLESLVGGVSAGAVASAGASAATAAAPVVVVILVVLAVFAFTLAIQAIFFGALFMSAVSFIIPIVAKPMMAALGVGAAYGNWATETTTNKYMAGVEFEEEKQMFAEFVKKIECAASGPACLRQWRLNHTKRPNSQDRGERYGLKIENFQVGSGNSVDIAYKESSYALPISFQISNNRHGLDGIPAHNIQFKIKMIDGDHGENIPYCQTKWLGLGEEVEGEGGRMTRVPSAYDVNNDGKEDDLYPGTSASTGYLKLNNISLENCHMLQPGAGINRKFKLYVKYDYFSQATLYYQAMSRQYQSAQGIEIKQKSSVTADTPVKAALGVDAPALYDVEDAKSNLAYAGQPIPIVATLNTGSSDIGYKVKNFTVRKSDQTCVMGTNGMCVSGWGSSPEYSTGGPRTDGLDDGQRLEANTGSSTGTSSPSSSPMQCSFEPAPDMGQNFMKLKPSAELRLIADSGTEEKEGIPDDHWFTSQNKPSVFGCVLGLTDPAEISPSGETLTMGVAANYTVRLEKLLKSFKVLNSKCGSMNCPFVFALDRGSFSRSVVTADRKDLKDGSDNSFYWIKKEAICDGLDAGAGGRGCTAVDEYDPYYSSRGARVRDGDIAVNITRGLVNDTTRDSTMFTCYVYDKVQKTSSAEEFTKKVTVGDDSYSEGMGTAINTVVGLRAERVEKVFDENYAINFTAVYSGNFKNSWTVQRIPDTEKYRSCYPEKKNN